MESTKAAKARAYFEQGYNCAQSVFAAFCEEMGLEEAFALRLSSSFGGGVGGLREVCGAFSGMVMVLGALKGYDMPDDRETKMKHYESVQALAKKFEAQYDTIICRDLLASHQIVPSPIPADRDAAYYAKRPCARYVEFCTKLLEDGLAGR